MAKATRSAAAEARVATNRTVFGAGYHSPGTLVEEFATKDPQHNLRLHGIDHLRAVRPARHTPPRPSTRPAGVGSRRAARAGAGRALMEAVTDFSREPVPNMRLGASEDHAAARALYASLAFSDREGRRDGPSPTSTGGLLSGLLHSFGAH